MPLRRPFSTLRTDLSQQEPQRDPSRAPSSLAMCVEFRATLNSLDFSRLHATRTLDGCAITSGYGTFIAPESEISRWHASKPASPRFFPRGYCVKRGRGRGKARNSLAGNLPGNRGSNFVRRPFLARRFPPRWLGRVESSSSSSSSLRRKQDGPRGRNTPRVTNDIGNRI